jgi:hypothetical protein
MGLLNVPFSVTGLPAQLVCGVVGLDAKKGTVLAVGACASNSPWQSPDPTIATAHINNRLLTLLPISTLHRSRNLQSKIVPTNV